MGAKSVLEFANLYMGSYEKELIHENEYLSPYIRFYKCFIDDIFIIWQGRKSDCKNI